MKKIWIKICNFFKNIFSKKKNINSVIVSGIISETDAKHHFENELPKIIMDESERKLNESQIKQLTDHRKRFSKN